MSGSNAQYPPQTGAYAVKVKNGAGWRDFNTVRLQISVGKPYHEGDKLAATINWARHRFDHVIICVNDTLQRFNHRYDFGLSASDAFQKAAQDGKDWIENNRTLINSLPSVERHRWEDWKVWPQYASALDMTLKLHQNNSEFRGAIRNNIVAFWKRKIREAGLAEAYRFAEFSALSESYLLEETAIFSMMFNRDEAVDVYPGTPLLPCTVFRGRDVDGAPEGLSKGTFTRIDFNKNKLPALANG